ncbi:MAG: hypothetical protein BJ554DRAFT_6400 [Olpidium bornovanus]|uniref:BAR domain-containing protein n=1 Tax=Olpidium bornovanus TaxID=278681 RepID=A0A8H7ZXX9_9FUNG|nr:MAG: hypothetical protein BJ554DRAFT_6400 [Olpidium bornovanus]
MAGEVDVNAMDANVDLSLQAAVKDSPSFRASVAMLEDDIDTLERWVDQLCKAIRLTEPRRGFPRYFARWKRTRLLAGQPPLGIGSQQPNLADPDMPMQALHIFADSLQATHAFNAKLVSDLEGNLLQPLTNLLRDDFRELKEARRANEKGQDKYESGLARYAASHKAKEASALREDAFQLYEVRKAYVRTSLDYTVKILKFR